MSKKCKFELKSYVVSNLTNPSLPRSFMLDETKWLPASSIFQLRMAQNQISQIDQEVTDSGKYY